MRQNVPVAGGNLLKQVLVEGAMTAVVVQNTAWRVWLSWSENAARRLVSVTPPESERIGRHDASTARVVPIAGKPAGDARFELFADGDGTRRFRLLSAAGDPILTSRGYQDAKSARSGMRSLMKSMVREDSYQRVSDDSDGRYFQIRAGNNRVLWASAPYDAESEMEADLERLIRSAREAAAG